MRLNEGRGGWCGEWICIYRVVGDMHWEIRIVSSIVIL